MIKTICTSLLFISPIVFSSSQPNAKDDSWRKLDPNKSVVMSLPHGKIIIELATQFSPHTAQRFVELVKSDFYNDEKFYRVIDGFVAQAGPQDGSKKDKKISPINIEDEFSPKHPWSFTRVQDKDMFAPQTGYKDGFAMGYSPGTNKAWLLHCPGVIAMARETAKDTATSHFYFTIGQAPRYLDRIMAVFGRVVYGMEHVQAITRTASIEGSSPIDKSTYTSMIDVSMMSELPKSEQMSLEIQNTESQTFINNLANKRKRENPFFYKELSTNIDICQTPIKTRISRK